MKFGENILKISEYFEEKKKKNKTSALIASNGPVFIMHKIINVRAYP